MTAQLVSQMSQRTWLSCCPLVSQKAFCNPHRRISDYSIFEVTRRIFPSVTRTTAFRIVPSGESSGYLEGLLSDGPISNQPPG